MYLWMLFLEVSHFCIVVRKVACIVPFIIRKAPGYHVMNSRQVEQPVALAGGSQKVKHDLNKVDVRHPERGQVSTADSEMIQVLCQNDSAVVSNAGFESISVNVSWQMFSVTDDIVI